MHIAQHHIAHCPTVKLNFEKNLQVDFRNGNFRNWSGIEKVRFLEGLYRDIETQKYETYVLR
jgi:hypothetical protein